MSPKRERGREGGGDCEYQCAVGQVSQVSHAEGRLGKEVQKICAPCGCPSWDWGYWLQQRPQEMNENSAAMVCVATKPPSCTNHTGNHSPELKKRKSWESWPTNRIVFFHQPPLGGLTNTRQLPSDATSTNYHRLLSVGHRSPSVGHQQPSVILHRKETRRRPVLSWSEDSGPVWEGMGQHRLTTSNTTHKQHDKWSDHSLAATHPRRSRAMGEGGTAGNRAAAAAAENSGVGFRWAHGGIRRQSAPKQRWRRHDRCIAAEQSALQSRPATSVCRLRHD